VAFQKRADKAWERLVTLRKSPTLSKLNGDRAAFLHLPDAFWDSGFDQSRRFRAIGQAIEALGFSDFEIEIGESHYLLRFRVNSPLHVGWIARILNWVTRKGPEPSAMECRISQQMVDRIDLAGRGQRKSVFGSPHPLSAAQQLRSVGAFLDSIQALAKSVAVAEGKAIVRFESSTGRECVETLSTEMLMADAARMRFSHDSGMPLPGSALLIT
jgi:hypothetical protein